MADNEAEMHAPGPLHHGGLGDLSLRSVRTGKVEQRQSDAPVKDHKHKDSLYPT